MSGAQGGVMTCSSCVHCTGSHHNLSVIHLDREPKCITIEDSI